MSAYCRNCGALLGVGNVYCLNCGTPVVLSVKDDDDEGPDTVIHRDVEGFDRQTVVIPQPQQVEPIVQVVEERTWFERNARNLIALVVSLAVLLALGIVLVLLINRRSPAIASNTVVTAATPTPSMTPTPLPSPSPTPTPAILSSAKCTITSDGKAAQAHKECDVKDCSNDPSTVGPDLDDGLEVTRLSGRAVPAGGKLNYSWVPVETDGEDVWVSSKKLTCDSHTAANGKPSPTPKKGTSTTGNTNHAARPPAGATALCKDGSYSFTRFGLAQCVFHGGVQTRY